MKENIIEIKDLTKKYGDLTAVNNLNLSIKKGEVFSLLGQNGAGKTTTLKMLSCLLKPTQGTALVAEKDIKKDYLKIKRIIGISPQETAIAERLNAKENLELIGGIYGLPKLEIKQQTEKLLDFFDLKNRAKEQVRKFSGGMKRKLSIAMALMPEPEIIFLDEPSLGLDPQARKNLWNYIKELKKEKKILLTSHYLNEVEALADRIAVIENGKIIALDSPDGLRNQFSGTKKLLIEAEISHKYIDEFKEKYENVKILKNGVEIRSKEIIFNDVVDFLRNRKIIINNMHLDTDSLEDVFLKLVENKVN